MKSSLFSHVLVPVFAVVFGACASAEIKEVASEMTAVETQLASSDGAKVELCLSYISLCEQGIGLCLEGSAAHSNSTFCADIQARCDATISSYCRVSADAGVAIDAGLDAGVGGGNGSNLLPDVTVTTLSFENGLFTATVLNQGNAASPEGVVIGVGYWVDGVQVTWGAVPGPLAAGASVTIAATSTVSLSTGTHALLAHVDDVHRFAESDETNNQRAQSATIAEAGMAPSGTNIGPKEVASTDLSKGTLFVSSTGTGSTCSSVNPCDIWVAVSQAKGGDVVFLRGGQYSVSRTINFYTNATASFPVRFESYPGESVIFDGSENAKGADVYIRVTGSFVHLRKFAVQNMPMQGIWIGGTDNVLDGIHVHHNGLSGIQVYSPYSEFPYGRYGSRNVIRNCVVNDNSGAGIFDSEFANGGNSDGISISSGADNRVEHCLSYHNSDDGIDTWRSTGSYVGYSISHSNGIAEGNGNGFKTGGLAPSRDTLVEHSLSYLNRVAGFDFNSGISVSFVHNTAWSNQINFVLGSDTVASKNIASGSTSVGAGIVSDNSWQRAGIVAFVSTEPTSPQFLVPAASGGFDDLGAFSNP